MKAVFPKPSTIEFIKKFVEISLHMLFATLVIYFLLAMISNSCVSYRKILLGCPFR
jgi:hypothetical protein